MILSDHETGGKKTFEYFNLNTTLQDVLSQVKGVRSSDVYLYHHDGPEICYEEEETTLGDVFGEDVSEIQLDCMGPEQGPKTIRNRGQKTVRVLNYERVIKEIDGLENGEESEEEVILPTKRARVSSQIIRGVGFH